MIVQLFCVNRLQCDYMMATFFTQNALHCFFVCVCPIIRYRKCDYFMQDDSDDDDKDEKREERKKTSLKT